MVCGCILVPGASRAVGYAPDRRIIAHVCAPLSQHKAVPFSFFRLCFYSPVFFYTEEAEHFSVRMKSAFFCSDSKEDVIKVVGGKDASDLDP